MNISYVYDMVYYTLRITTEMPFLYPGLLYGIIYTGTAKTAKYIRMRLISSSS